MIQSTTFMRDSGSVKIALNTDDNSIELERTDNVGEITDSIFFTKQEAEDLYNELQRLLGKAEPISVPLPYIPGPQVEPYPPTQQPYHPWFPQTYPWFPNWYVTTSSTTGVTADKTNKEG